MPRKLTQKDFENKANQKHGKGTFDYSLCQYSGTDNKITIICKNKHHFRQTPHAHLSGQGCPYCSKKAKLNKKTFTKLANKLHHNKYDYSLVIYLDNKNKVTIICPVHGPFKQRPDSHVRRKNPSGCYKCGGTNKLTTNQFIEKAKKYHKNFYDYSLVNYTNNNTHVEIICLKHGIFKQRPGKHLQGDGCPKCAITKSVKTSKGQTELYNCLKKHLGQSTKIISEKTISIDTNKCFQVDIFIPKTNIIVEYYGDYWHCNPKKYKADYINTRNKKTAQQIWDFDKQRTQKLESFGYKVLIVWESDFKNKKNQVVNKICRLHKSK